MTDTGDQAFRAAERLGLWREMTYGGAFSFMRCRNSCDPAGVEVAISGVPFDTDGRVPALAATSVAREWLCMRADEMGAEPAPVGRL